MLEEIGTYLKDQGLIPSGTFIFYGAMADVVKVNGQDISSDECTCLYNTQGFVPTMTFDNKGVEYPGLQIMCRGYSYQEVEQRANSIFQKLHGNTEVAGIMNIMAQQSPFSIGQDEKKRWEFSVNFKLVKQM